MKNILLVWTVILLEGSSSTRRVQRSPNQLIYQQNYMPNSYHRAMRNVAPTFSPLDPANMTLTKNGSLVTGGVVVSGTKTPIATPDVDLSGRANRVSLKEDNKTIHDDYDEGFEKFDSDDDSDDYDNSYPHAHRLNGDACIFKGAIYNHAATFFYDEYECTCEAEGRVSCVQVETGVEDCHIGDVIYKTNETWPEGDKECTCWYGKAFCRLRGSQCTYRGKTLIMNEHYRHDPSKEVICTVYGEVVHNRKRLGADIHPGPGYVRENDAEDDADSEGGPYAYKIGNQTYTDTSPYTAYRPYFAGPLQYQPGHYYTQPQQYHGSQRPTGSLPGHPLSYQGVNHPTHYLQIPKGSLAPSTGYPYQFQEDSKQVYSAFSPRTHTYQQPPIQAAAIPSQTHQQGPNLPPSYPNGGHYQVGSFPQLPLTQASYPQPYSPPPPPQPLYTPPAPVHPSQRVNYPNPPAEYLPTHGKQRLDYLVNQHFHYVPVVHSEPVRIERGCPFDYVRLDSFCAHVSNKRFDWNTANSYCLSQGGQLAYATNIRENAALLGHLQTKGHNYGWLGFADLDGYGYYFYGKSRTPLYVHNLGFNQNMYHDLKPGDELHESSGHCIAFGTAGSYHWYITRCQANFPAICRAHYHEQDTLANFDADESDDTGDIDPHQSDSVSPDVINIEDLADKTLSLKETI